MTLDDLPTLTRGIKSKRPFDAFFATMLLLFGASALWYVARFGVSAPPVIVAVVCLGGAGLQFRSTFRPIAAHPGLRALLDTPEKVVWWYVVRGRSGNYIRMHLDTRKTYDLPMRRRKDSPAASAELAPHLPLATQGFDGKRLQAYLEDPNSLRRAPSA